MRLRLVVQLMHDFQPGTGSAAGGSGTDPKIDAAEAGGAVDARFSARNGLCRRRIGDYSEISEEWMANGRTDEKLAELRQTAFMGETLRGSLMSAYLGWQTGSLVIGLGGLVSGLGVVFLGASHE
jgi:hypothetical protein